ncbi:hypothetical protein Dsin_022331 [Dipteronia sinensis]|uniref:Endonuclease/exonuclease/phosphatase domain-containing protein n=1 Tax=Dipteronia sinensis TaxID=43782 RepID=A0AAE0A2M5_9ROSI|nr:hypothetical protein Dsin_022331 [Dipteronia sinensis]
MRTLAWNARGLGGPRAIHILQNLKREMDPEIMFLMETKLGVQALERIRIKLGYLGKLVVESVGRSGGLCLFWSDRICADLISFSRFHIDVKITSSESKLLRFDWLLWQSRFNTTGPFVDVVTEEGPPRQRRLIEEFREAVDDCELMDIGFRGPGFTWSNRRDGSAMVQERLDRGFQYLLWHQMFPNSFVQHLGYWKSDHRPILVEILTASDQYLVVGERRRRRFHFEACWADCEECDVLASSS